MLYNEAYNSQKLTFKQGIGDAPDDWYIIYAHPEKHMINAAAYIVTAGKTKVEAEKDPHAIQYENYQLVDGIPLATTWTFWSWSEENGLIKQLGMAQLSDFKFVSITEPIFQPPKDFVQKSGN